MPPQSGQQISLFVNDSCFDDVGEVLRRMGKGFEYQPAASYRSVPPANAVLFLNCGGPLPAAENELRSFLESGGTIYASDLQASMLAGMLPEVFRYEQVTPSGRLRAQVMDQALAEIIGYHIDLEFDMGGWEYLLPVQGARDRVAVNLVAHEDVHALHEPVAERAPIVVSYDFPQGGTLFYTAFHNRAQESKQEEDLLRFLLFRPIMARDLKKIKKGMSAASIKREYTGGLRRSVRERTFGLESAGEWTAILSWNGQGKLAVELLGTSGASIDRGEEWTGPLTVSGTVPAGGKIRVRCSKFVQDEIPFVLVVATGAAAKGLKPGTETGTLKLERPDGKCMVFTGPTAVGRAKLKPFCEEGRFYSSHQFTLAPTSTGSWRLKPRSGTTNATFVNGKPCSGPTAMEDGDVISVGNPASGKTKGMLRVRLG